MALIKDTFKVFDAATTAGTYTFDNSTVNADSLELSISGSTFTIAATGKLTNASTASTLSFIDFNGFGMDSSATSNGTYLIPIAGMASVTITSTSVSGGALTVIARAI